MTQAVLNVCVTCRRVAGGAPVEDEVRPGRRLLDAMEALGAPEGVSLRAVECLSTCKRGSAVALTGGPARWSYVYGDMDHADHAEAILEGAAAYAATEDGLVPWRERPEVFRKQCVARIPPLAPKEE